MNFTAFYANSSNFKILKEFYSGVPGDKIYSFLASIRFAGIGLKNYISYLRARVDGL